MIAEDPDDILELMGATFETLDSERANQLGVEGGVVVNELDGGLLKNQTDIKEGFIITGINNEKVTSVDGLRKALKHQKGGVLLQGMYENYPGELFFAFGLPE